MADIKAVDFYGDAKKVFAKSEYDKGYEKGREDALNEVLNLVKAPRNEAYCSLIRTGDIDICDEYTDCVECIVKYLVGKDINVPNKKEGEKNE